MFELDIDDEYDKLCGEMFLTIKGNIIFHCTLCEEKFKDFPDYNDHIIKLHYQSLSCVALEPHETLDESYKSPKAVADYEGNDEISIEVFIENQEEEIAADIETDLNDCDLTVAKEYEQNLKENEQCGKTINRKIVSPNERKHQCKICGFVFTQIFNLRAHVRRHFNEKRFPCSQCSKAFHTRTELNTHLRRHKGERPFICEECGQLFVTAGALTMHVKRHKDIRNHECPQCNKKFFDSYALKIHLAGHTGDRPYKCSLCDSTFSRKKALAVHKKIHENKREYQCKYCDSSFNQMPGLYSHIKSKHSRSVTGKT